jgi:hypothetical protein
MARGCGRISPDKWSPTAQPSRANPPPRNSNRGATKAPRGPLLSATTADQTSLTCAHAIRLSNPPTRAEGRRRLHAQRLLSIADLSAKAYSHNSARVHRHLCPARKAPTDAPQAAGMDAGVYGGTRRNGPEFHLRPGERKKGNLHPQPGSACHCLRNERLKTDVASLKASSNAKSTWINSSRAPLVSKQRDDNLQERHKPSAG